MPDNPHGWITLKMTMPQDAFRDADKQQAAIADLHTRVVADLAERGRRLTPGEDYKIEPRYDRDAEQRGEVLVHVKARTVPLDDGQAVRKPRVLVDFDGVIHRYSRGWADGTVYDGPMPGAKACLAALDGDGYELVIFSTRSADQITEALAAWGWPAYRVTNVKEPAVAMIDDRAIRFEDWDQAVDELRERYPVTDS